MDWFPLWNSLRIAAISTVLIFFLGIAAAYYIAKLPKLVKGVLDVVLTLPLVLPPTVVGYLLLRLLGPRRIIGAWALETFGVRLVMVWWSAVFAAVAVAFPLMYRTARGAFESFDETLSQSAQTLGLPNAWIFWRVRMPYCRQGILAGTVLAFARALGEYGATSMLAGYTPGKTATIATTVYQLWRTNDEAGAMRWVLVDIVISAVVLLAVNLGLSLLSPKLDFNSFRLGRFGLVFYVNGVLGSVAVLELLRWLEARISLRPLIWCGKNSMFLMATHLPWYIAPVLVAVGKRFYTAAAPDVKYFLVMLAEFAALMAIEFVMVWCKDKIKGTITGGGKEKAVSRAIQYL